MGDQPEPAVPPAAPPANPPAPKPEIAIPKPRFDEVNARMKKAEEERDALKLELQAARAEASAHEPEPDPAPHQEPQPPAEPEQPPEPPIDRDEVQRLRIAARHGITEETAALVQSYMKKGNDEGDAIALARLKAPKAFAARDRRGFDPTTHSAAPPGSGRPQPKPEPTEREIIATTRDPHKRGQLALNAAVNHVREQMKGQFK